MKKNQNVNAQTEVFEEEKTVVKKEEKVVKTQKAEKPRTFAAFKARVNKARHKAEFVGLLYLLFTICLVGVVILPVFVGTYGEITILNFWKPFLEIKHAGKNLVAFIMSVIGSVLYLFIVLSVTVNMFKSFSCLSNLYKKKPSRQNGYNRPANAMQKMGKIFSSSAAAFVVFGFMMNVIADVTATPMFFVVILVSIIIHFWLGILSGNVSFFEVGKHTEIKRVGGRFAPFIRNVFQFVVVVLMMYYFTQVAVVTNLLTLLQKGAFNALKSDVTALLVYVVLPVVQILMMIWIIAMFRHAMNPSEFHHDGKHAPGRLTFRWMAFLLLLTSAGAFVLTVMISKKTVFPISLGCIYIAALALAAFIEEICMCRLPNDRDNYIVEYDAPAQQQPVFNINCPGGNGVMAAPCQGYHVPISCINEPGVFLQPNGQPIMVMPLVAGARPAPQMVAPTPYDYDYKNPYATYAPVNAPQPFDPYHQAPQLTPAPVVEATVEKKENLVKGEGVGLSREELYKQALHEQNIQALTEKWVGMASKPVPRDEAAGSVNYAKNNPYMAQYSSAETLTEEDLQKPLPGKTWTIDCPDCGTKLNVQEGSYAYRCPECGCAFQLNKIIKKKEEK